MQPRDELNRLIGKHTGTAHSRPVADAILAAGWRPPARVVATIDEVLALPPGTRLLSQVTGHVWWMRHDRHLWEGSGGAYSRPLDFVAYEAPLTVIWHPDGGDTP